MKDLDTFQQNHKIASFAIVVFLISAIIFIFQQFQIAQAYKIQSIVAGSNTLSTMLWSADMESGNLDQWWSPGTEANPGNNHLGGEFDSGIGKSVASQDFAHTGAWSAKMTITTPSGTSETSGTRLFRWGEPQTNSSLYYSVWYYYPKRYSIANWWNVLQWKSKRSDTINDPFYILNIGNRGDGSMYYYLYNWQLSISYNQSLVNIPEGKWTHVEAFYLCAGDNTGHVTIWQDGIQIFDVSDVQTRYSDGVCQWSVNNYSNLLAPSPSTIYTDDAAISTSYISDITPTVTPTPIPSITITSTPTPTVTPGQPTLTPTPSVNPSCICKSDDSCDASCTFDTYSDVTYNNPIKCSRETSIVGPTPNPITKTSYCQRYERTKGDVDGDGAVTNLDYFYYVSAVNGGGVPLNVDPDVNGDGKVSPSDRAIIIRSLGMR